MRNGFRASSTNSPVCRQTGGYKLTQNRKAPIQTLVTRYVGSTRQRQTEVQADKQQARIAAQK